MTSRALLVTSNAFSLTSALSVPPAATHDWQKLVTAVQDHIGSLNWGYREQLRDNRVTYLNAYATFVDEHTLKVRVQPLSFVLGKNCRLSSFLHCCKHARDCVTETPPPPADGGQEGKCEVYHVAVGGARHRQPAASAGHPGRARAGHQQ